METIYEAKARTLLESYHYLKERRYRGDYDAAVELIDLERAIELAELSDFQNKVLTLTYVDDLMQKQVAEILDVSQPNVSYHKRAIIRKIADVYKEWGELF